MSQWESVVVTNTEGQREIRNVEVGLAPGQTSGYVGGSYVIRDPTSDLSKPYVEAGNIQTVKSPEGRYRVEVGGKVYYTNTPPEIGSFRAETGYTSVRRTGMLTPEEAEQQYQYQVATGQIKPPQIITKKPSDLYQSGFYSEKGTLERTGFDTARTIEGTTVFTKEDKPIYFPKYGKMVKRGERTEPFLDVFTPDAFIDQIEKTSSDISIKIDKLNKEVSEKYGLKETVAGAEKFYRHAEFLQEYDPKYQKLQKKSVLGKAMTEYAVGFTEELAQKPVTAAGNTLFAILVTKGIGGVAAKAPILMKGVGTGKLASKINTVNVLGASLAGMYGVSVAERYIEAPDKARFAGQITATELLPFAAGGYVGTRKLPSIPTKEITRRAEITFLKTVREGRILQAKTERDFEMFIRDESAELLKKRRAYQKLIQVHKPEVAKKAEEVEVIRADIALEKQMKAEARVKQLSISSPKVRQTYKKVVETLQHPTTRQLPILVNLNIQKVEAILNPESRVIAIQRQASIQEPASVQRYKPIQEARAIQEAKTIQIAEAILKSKTEQKNIQKTREILKQKPKLEMPIKKVIPLLSKDFMDEMEALAKRKRKGKWVWDVKNPVPTFEEVIG